MSKHHGISPQQHSARGPLDFEAGETEILQLIDSGNSKTAVDRAKDLHKQINNAASEELLITAYRARIDSLRAHRMKAEADALAALVLERYPSAAQAFKEPSPTTKAALSRIDDLVRPLVDAQLPSEQRTAIENELKKHLADPSALANCAALPTDHPLRLQARAVADAFTAVTSGPVLEEQVELSSVSRRSPLAPWKALVRAIAAFYAHDDDAAERYLKSIDPESPPARAAAPLCSAIAGKADAQLKPAARLLYDAVAGVAAELREALDALDGMFASHKNKAIAQIRHAMKLATEAAPELVPRLRQHVDIRGDSYGLELGRVRAALGGIVLKNAHYWLLSARTAEDPKKPHLFPACCLWEQFRKHAIHEGWFPAKGPEAAALWVHMAGLLARATPEILEEAYREFRSFPGLGALVYDDQPKEIRAALAGSDPADQYYLNPDKLFERACNVDPRPEIFQAWMNWATKVDYSYKTRDKVAEAWRRALPSDVRPLLALTMSAEERNALQKAIGFLEKAEQIDPLNPDVRRTRVRLLLGSALKRLRERHAHLALRDVAVLEGLPQAREGACSAMIGVLRYLCCLQKRDEAGCKDQLLCAEEALGSQAAARFLAANVAGLAGFWPNKYPEIALLKVLKVQAAESMAGIVARTFLIANEFGMEFEFPRLDDESLEQDVRERSDELDNAQLRALGEAALCAHENEIAYAVSVAGMARGASSEARFLLIRARSLAERESNRSAECLDAADELARRNRDMQLLDQIVEARRVSFEYFTASILGLPDDRRELSEGGLNAILERERKAVSYPAREPSFSPQRGLWEEFSSLYADEDEEDEFDEEDAFIDEQDFQEFSAFVEQAARQRAPQAKAGSKRKRRRSRKAPF